MDNLKDIYRSHTGKVSDKWELYLDEYTRLLNKFRNEPISILEIGIQNGGSLEIWSKYFAAAKSILGCDIDSNCENLRYDDERINVIVGDVNDDSTKSRIIELNNRFDIIIDDGSHTSADIIETFVNYYPFLNEGGLYIVEDIHCSYWKEFGGGLYSPFTAIEFFKKLTDVINHEHWGIESSTEQFLSRIIGVYDIHPEHFIKTLNSIHSISFANSLVTINKLTTPYHGLGNRVISGNSASVNNEVISLGGCTSVAPPQTENKWSTLQCSPSESFESLQQELTERTNLNLSLQNKIDDLHEKLILSEAKNSDLNKNLAELSKNLESSTDKLAKQKLKAAEYKENIDKLSFNYQSMLNSTSWKITKPIRNLSVYLSKFKHLVHGINQKQLVKRFLTLPKVYSLSNRFLSGFLHKSTSVTEDTDNKSYHSWYESRYNSDKVSRWSEDTKSLEFSPLISIIMPVHRPCIQHFSCAVDSVLAQSYSNWELCIVDDASNLANLTKIIADYASNDTRIKFTENLNNQHISLSSNEALELASGDYFILLDHDDVLPNFALSVLALSIAKHPDAEFFYSDEDRITESNTLVKPFFKPDWSPHLLYSQNYITHLTCFKKSLYEKCGGFRKGLEGAQDYDLFLRYCYAANEIIHIPEILYHWREHGLSTSLNSDSKPYAHDAGLSALRDHLHNKYPKQFKGDIESNFLFTYSPRFLLSPSSLVSIIIPTKDKIDLLKKCIDSILSKSLWKNFEILVINNNSTEDKSFAYFEKISQHPNIRVIDAPIPFNWSKVNNIGASHAQGDVFVFLNNDIEIITPDWINILASYSLLPDVGTVGPLLLYENDTIQHAGAIVGMNGWADHVFKSLPPKHHVGPFVSPLISRNVLAVTGACTSIEAAKFKELGGYDEEFIICGSDIELGVRSSKKGYYNVYTPDVRLYHFESMTRDNYVPEVDFVNSDIKYAPYRTDQTDPFFNPNLDIFNTTPNICANDK